MEKIELMKMIDEEDYSKKKIFQEIDPIIFENKGIQDFIKGLGDKVYCYDLLVSHSRAYKLIALIVTPLDQELNEIGVGTLVWLEEDYGLANRDINMEDVLDLEPIITKTYMV